MEYSFSIILNSANYRQLKRLVWTSHKQQPLQIRK